MLRAKEDMALSRSYVDETISLVNSSLSSACKKNTITGQVFLKFFYGSKKLPLPWPCPWEWGVRSHLFPCPHVEWNLKSAHLKQKKTRCFAEKPNAVRAEPV